MRLKFRALMALMSLALLLPWHGFGQAATQTQAFSKAELEQLVAPIALYSDPLLSQILMASTYPLEIVSAARFVKDNPNLKDKALEESLLKQPWDESVKSLALVPQVLTMLNEKLDMTQKLGDAFLAQQKEVLGAVQSLRAKAQEAGNLQSSKEQVINTQQEGDNSYITIQPADPEVVFVPSYDPNTTYGSWPYSDYPPYEYYPPGYPQGNPGLWYGAGLATGRALWGTANWGAGSVGINPLRYNNFNQTNIVGNDWRHNVDHRKGVQYRDQATQQRFGKGQLQGSEAREAFRGRADQGREKLRQSPGDALKRPSQLPSQGLDRGRGQGQLDRQRPNQGLDQGRRQGQLDRQRPSQGRRQGQLDRQRPSQGQMDRQRPSQGQTSRHAGQQRGAQQRGGAFDGVARGRETKNFSQRGKSSNRSRGGGGRSGGSRGGGSRGGGRR